MNSPSLYLLGAGGHAAVVLDALLSLQQVPAGILDPARQAGQDLFGVSVLGGDEWLDRIDAATSELVNGVGANPDVRIRRDLFLRLVARGFRFRSLVHGAASVGRQCVFGQGAQVMAGAILQCRVSVADNVVINTSASVDHDCVLEAHAFVAPGATLCADVRMREAAFIGAGAVILPGVEIGSGAIVGAGSVVTHVVAAGQIVAGNPAMTIGTKVI